MDVSVIVVNYNTCQMTKQCIDSIFEKTRGIDYEVILVDNNSSDGSKEYFENDPRVIYIYNDLNVGFGSANNIGYNYANGDFIFLLNSDTILVNNAIYELWNFMVNHPDLAISGGSLVDEGLKSIHSFGLMLPSIKYELDLLLRGCISRKLYKRMSKDIDLNGYAKVGYITGADMMLRRSNIENIGLFDPDFFMYYEETEMTHRYALKGYDSAYYPKAIIKHLVGKSFSVKKNRESLFLNSRILYYKKIGYSSFDIYICNILYFLYIITSAFVSLFRLDFICFKNSILRLRILFNYSF